MQSNLLFPLRGELFMSNLSKSVLFLFGVFLLSLPGAIAQGNSCYSNSKIIFSDSTWLESSVVTPTPRGKTWSGVSGLPADASFSLAVQTGQTYSSYTRPVVDESENIIAGNNIRYFRQSFTVDTIQGNSAEFLMYFDDNAEVFINGYKLFRQDVTTNYSFKGSPHRIHFLGDGSVENGGAGYDAFDVVENVHLDTILQLGTNHITVVVRNFSGVNNKGGFSLSMHLGKSGFKVETTSLDTISCSNDSVYLQGSSTSPSGTPQWTTVDGNILSGAGTFYPLVNQGGFYTLTVTDTNGCSVASSLFVEEDPCIVPYLPAPDSGKVPNLIGSELNSLAKNPGYLDSLEFVFQRRSDSVFIEVIAIQGQYNNLLNLLKSPSYGLTRTIDNGPNSLIITGLFPISNLPKLDSLPNLINYVRPLFPPLVNIGVVTSEGDESVRADFVRGGFNVFGDKVKVGVLSDSYNTTSGNQAQTDINNEDLPGPGNALNSTPVSVVKDYPFGIRTDEGRAMLQIVHDIAPMADLAFRTGYLSAGDMAQGIYQLIADSCDVIVDDITYITEPFLDDGIVARAVDSAAAQGVSYFSAAGNFAEKSYAAFFNPAPAPADLMGEAHDFSGGDLFQKVSLERGSYTIVLQWQDSIYSSGETSSGTANDLDIYLTDDAGNTLFGFNRVNTAGDPLEVLSFTVKEKTTSNILIVRSSGTANVYFKYIVFRGELSIDEYQTGSSTIVGQANAEGAMAVGAVLYTNTPAFGGSLAVSDFSSRGGTPVRGVPREKPDFVAPHGVNTNVPLGGDNFDGDAFPNFFGTSAAAPHAAGVAALVKSANQKFEGSDVSPANMRQILRQSSIDMGAAGHDVESGNGFIQASTALLSLANPSPEINQISLTDTSKTAGVDSVEILIQGEYLTGATVIILRNDTLPSNFISEKQIIASVPPFSGNPALRAFTPPITSSLLDGGFSDTLQFFAPLKTEVLVIARDTSKRYSEAIPELIFYVLVDSIPLAQTPYSLADLGLDSVTMTTTATSMSDIGNYLVRAQMDTLDPNDSAEAVLIEMFDYQFMDGVLTINQMPLTIIANDTTILFGQALGDFQFTYSYPDSLIDPADQAYFQNFVSTSHDTSIANALALVNRAQGRALVNADVERLAYMTGGRALVNARALVNSLSSDTTYVIDIAKQSLFDYQNNPDSATLTNAYPLVNARALVNAYAVAQGRALVNAARFSQGRALVNALPLVNAYPLVNGQPVENDSSDVVLILDEEDVDTTTSDTIVEFTPINLITGDSVGFHFIVPAAFINRNYVVTYQPGELIIAPQKDSLSVVTDSTWRMSTYFTTNTSNFNPWPGVAGNLPASSSFSLPVDIGQPYPWNPMDTVDGTQIFRADSGLTFFRKTFNLFYNEGVEARFTSSMDDGIEIYVNGHLLAREDDRDVSNFRSPFHDLKFESNATVSNPFFGGEAYDLANPVLLDSLVNAGENELIIVLRNNYVGDKGGLSLRLDLETNPSLIKKGKAIASAPGNEKASILMYYPNPVKDWLRVSDGSGQDRNYEVDVIDLGGRLVTSFTQQKMKAGLLTLDVTRLEPGMYILRFRTEGSVQNLRILKEW